MPNETLVQQRLSGAPPSPDAAVAGLAARQHGVVTTGQLVSAGLTEGAITWRVTNGRLHRVHRGVYAVGHRGLSREGRWLAAVFSGGARAALSHLSAAALLETWRGATRGCDVLAPGPRRPVDGIRFHECRRLDERDVTELRGIRVTTVARLLVEETDVLTIADELTNVIKEAAFRKRFSLAATRAAMARANGRHNLDVLDEAVDHYLDGSAGLKSRLEKAFRSLIGDEFPNPRVNTHVLGFEVDVHWPDRRLVVEIDGPGHERPTAKRDDARQDAVLAAAGYRTLRFTDVELERRPDLVLRGLREAYR